MPTMCALMTGKTSCWRGGGRPRRSPSGSSPRHHREARDGREHRGARRGGAGSRAAARPPSSGRRASARSSRAIFCGSGRTRGRARAPTSMMPAAASQGTTSASASRSFPAKSGLKTTGRGRPRRPRRRARTRSPRARRSGGYMSAAAARASRTVPLAIADDREADDHESARVRQAAEAGDARPDARRSGTRRDTGMRP